MSDITSFKSEIYQKAAQLGEQDRYEEEAQLYLDASKAAKSRFGCEFPDYLEKCAGIFAIDLSRLEDAINVLIENNRIIDAFQSIDFAGHSHWRIPSEERQHWGEYATEKTYEFLLSQIRDALNPMGKSVEADSLYELTRRDPGKSIANRLTARLGLRLFALVSPSYYAERTNNVEIVRKAWELNKLLVRPYGDSDNDDSFRHRDIWLGEKLAGLGIIVDYGKEEQQYQERKIHHKRRSQ